MTQTAAAILLLFNADSVKVVRRVLFEFAHLVLHYRHTIVTALTSIVVTVITYRGMYITLDMLYHE